MATTLAGAKAALSAVVSPFLIPLRGTLSSSALSQTALADDALFPAAIAAGLFAAGITPEDPTDPDDGDMELLPSSSWPKFFAFAELTILEIAAMTAATIPSRIAHNNNALQVEYDPRALNQMLQAKKAVLRVKYPDAMIDVTSGTSMTKGWLTVKAPKVDATESDSEF